MFVLIRWGNGELAFGVRRGGKPEAGKTLMVQKADRVTGEKPRLRRGAKRERVKVLGVAEADGLPLLTVEWLKEVANVA